ncbi:hypothetical protein yc1106_06734 [Curvularia clavata]|uniref:AAA+ ATPase domain-containing protein n=1 Tax=Curvularia clavata TaxID=95742 RepID=A0A9Q8ZCZ9_CURCL|nr:hypothetical protein yc1106_06734 [Curvularia clavata]
MPPDTSEDMSETANTSLAGSALNAEGADHDGEHASGNPNHSASGGTESLDRDPDLMRALRLFKLTRDISACHAMAASEKAQSKRPTGGFVTPNPPTVLRTVYRQPVKGLMTHPTYDRGLDEREYDEYRDSASGSAIELKKDVRVIPPNSISGARSINGTQDIIDHIVSEKMIIRSPALIKTIKSVVSYWPSSAYYDNQTRLELNRPYRSICVYRDEFQHALESDKAAYDRITVSERRNKDAKELAKSIEELEMLLNEVDKVQKDPIAEEKRRNTGDKGRQIPPKATFDMLWMLYKPGEQVYVQTEDFEGLCRIRLLVWDRGRALSTDAEDPYAAVELNLWYLDHDGTGLNRRHHCLKIERFQGEHEILELPAYPIKYMPLSAGTSFNLTERGKKYCHWIAKGFSHCWYDGLISRHKSTPYTKHMHIGYRGKVVIDPEYYHREKGRVEGAKWLATSTSTSPANRRPDAFTKLDPADTKTLENPDLPLLPQWIRGFTIGTRGVRDWAWLNVDQLKDYTYKHDLINTVAFSDNNDLDHIKAATKAYRDTPETFKPDHIAEKGEGRIILLHGSPGLGKTYTAECIAEWSGRPLLRLTCAELGMDPATLEANLNRHFRRAERWDAIVLIDEADLFLELRDRQRSLESVAVVAVFLRALEYYSGIMFLTTNRVQSFDPAALDRMMLIIRYQPPDEEVRRRIRESCIKKMNEMKRFDFTADAEEAYREIDKDNKYAWSGREITSVLKHASLLGEYDGNNDGGVSSVKINGDHIRKAMKKIKDIDVYFNGIKSKKGTDKMIRLEKAGQN